MEIVIVQNTDWKLFLKNAKNAERISKDFFADKTPEGTQVSKMNSLQCPLKQYIYLSLTQDMLHISMASRASLVDLFYLSWDIMHVM